MDSLESQYKYAHLSCEKRELIRVLMKKKKIADDGAELPLSSQQQQMWIADQIDPKDPSYNNPAAIFIKGGVDLTIVENCINEIIRRHSILRASFRSRGGIPYQVIHRQRMLKLKIYRLNHEDEKEKQRMCYELLNEEVNRPFDLTNDLLIRAVSIKLNENHDYLLINFHHIVSDGWTLDIFFKEFSALYNSYSKGASSSLTEVQYQYTDYVRATSVLQSSKDLDFWEEKLKPAPHKVTFPMGNYHIESLTNKGEWKPENISAELSKSIIQQTAIAGSTLFNYLMASYVTLLHIYTDQIDICVGTPYANRDKCETQKMMGYFVNTIVLRNNLDGDPTFKEILDRVQKNAIEAYRHASVPFYKVVEIIRPERQLNGNPLFQTMLVMNNAPVDNLKIGDLEIKRVEIYPSTARFDILMSFAETSKGIRLFINYKVQMFDETDIDRIFKDFNKLLKILATGNSNMKLSNIKKLMEGCVVNKPAKFTRS